VGYVAVTPLPQAGQAWTGVSSGKRYRRRVGPPAEVRLDSHCAHSPDVLPWVVASGFTHARWSLHGSPLEKPPSPGQELDVEAQSPFLATVGVPFHTLWLPPLVQANGLQPSDAACLVELRVVRAVWRRPDAVTHQLDGGRRAATLRARVEAVVDPFEQARALPPHRLSLQGWSVVGSGHETHEVMAFGERVYVTTSLQGDVSFDYLLHAREGWLALLVDESICRGFFYAGRGDLPPAELLPLLRSR
jgi:hypothetical protein